MRIEAISGIMGSGSIAAIAALDNNPTAIAPTRVSAIVEAECQELCTEKKVIGRLRYAQFCDGISDIIKLHARFT